jgi:hypothetical protein
MVGFVQNIFPAYTDGKRAGRPRHTPVGYDIDLASVKKEAGEYTVNRTDE